MSSLFFLLLLGTLFWFWFDSLRAHEIAKAVCREMCGRYEVQLLDQTIALARLGLERDPQRRLRVRRHYRFEFTVSGENREQGHITMVGSRMSLFELPGYTSFIHNQ